MPEPTPRPSVPDVGHPLGTRLQRAIAAHPILRDQKKLTVSVLAGVVRLEGQVFTQDMLRQVHDLVGRLPGGEDVRVAVEAEVKPPKDRTTVGRVPAVSQGPSSVDRNYSVKRRRRGP